MGLIQQDRCPYKQGWLFRHRQKETFQKVFRDTPKTDGDSKLRREASGKSGHSHPFISDQFSPYLWKNTFLLLEYSVCVTKPYSRSYHSEFSDVRKRLCVFQKESQRGFSFIGYSKYFQKKKSISLSSNEKEVIQLIF